jgi:Cytochrome c554 and c-prime
LTQPTIPDENPPPAPGEKPFLSRRLVFQLAALALIVVSGLAGTGLARWLRPPEAETPKGPLTPYFHDWPKPDLVLVLTADQHGYLLPCGCSKPQEGGLERRYNLIQMLNDRGWPTTAVDLGNVPQVKAPADLPNVQKLIKYRYAMLAMQKMGYTAVGIGDYEASMPLFDALAEFALNEAKPRVVSANLMDREDKYPEQTKAWQQADPIKGVDLKLGVTADVGPSVYDLIKKKDPSAHFGDSPAALNAVLKEMDDAGIDLRVLLYMGSLNQGPDKAPGEAAACAEAFPQFPLIVAQDDSDLARAAPVWVTNPKTNAKTMIVSLGHKAKSVGVVGVYRTGNAAQPFDLRYQLVDMSEDFTTPKGQEATQPILKMMEEYTKELKDGDYLHKYPQIDHPNQAAKETAPKYVGTERCTDCHISAGKVWAKTPHSHAYKILVDATRPSNRQYDPECIVCHTVGFGYKSGFRSEKETPKLLNVGCESCHGPGSLHANKPNDLALRAEMNPWKAPEDETPEQKTRRTVRIGDACQKCHDPENDVNWTGGGFERNWPKIAHPTPPEEK